MTLLPLLFIASLLHGAAAPQESETEQAVSEVLVVGTLRAPWQFRGPRFTPAHLRAVLAAAKPDRIGVECPPEWLAEGRLMPWAFEAAAVALPYAAEHDLAVHGVDVLDLERWETADEERVRRHVRMLERGLNFGALPLELFGRVPDDRIDSTRLYFERPDNDFLFVNEIGDETYGKAWREADSTAPGFGGERNQAIAERVHALLEAHPGERLVVFFGAGHKAVIDALLAQRPGVRVLRLGEEVPLPTREEIAAAWEPADLAVVLGHNLDGERSYFHPQLVDLARMERLVERLAAEPGWEPVAAYYRARLAFHGGEPERALAQYDSIPPPTANEPRLYPFPMGQWRMRYGFDQAVRLERARCLAALGRDQEARALLEDLAEELSPPAEFDERRSDGPRLEGLGDLGFESGEILGEARQGHWWTEEIAAGRLVAELDADETLEGRAALRLTGIAKRPLGRAALAQEFEVTEAMRAADTLRFELACRSEGVSDLSLTAFVRSPDGQRLEHLGRAAAQMPPATWTRAAVRFKAPPDAASIELFVIFDLDPGDRLWLDDGSLSIDSSRAPKEWGAATLADEYPRTLLEEL